MTNTKEKRDVIERKLRVKRKSIPINPKSLEEDWIFSDEVYAYLDTWYELVKHYQENDDIEIGVMALLEYISFCGWFREIIGNEDFTSEKRERASEYLDILEGHMEEIVREMGRNYGNRPGVNPP